MEFISELAEENQHSWKAAGRSGRKRGTTWRFPASPPNRSRPPSSSPQEPKHADWGRVPGAGGISCHSPATQTSCHIWGDDPFRGHCLLGLGSDSGRPEMELGARRLLFQAQLWGLSAPGHPKARGDNPGTEAATSLRIPTTELGQHSGDYGSLPPLSARRQVGTGRSALRQALHRDGTGCWRGSRGEKGGPAGAPLPEGASPPAALPPRPAHLQVVLR